MAPYWLVCLQVAAPWSPPAQAAWQGDSPAVAVRVEAGAISMRETAPITVEVEARGGIAVSPFLQATRGIAFEVRDRDGHPVAPREPMMTSPPPPPLGVDGLVAIDAAHPYRVQTTEAARTIFPGAGTYTVRAVLSFMNFPATPVRYARVVSNPITVTVSR